MSSSTQSRSTRAAAGVPTVRRAPFSAGDGAKLAVLIGYAAIAVAPIALIVLNSIKTRQAIFTDPLALPLGERFGAQGYETVARVGDFNTYFINSMIVTVGSVVGVLVLGAMAAFALATYEFRGRRTIALYLILGILLPSRLGSVATIEVIASLGLINHLLGLILVYTAFGLPVAVFVLTEFFREVPREIPDSGRIDGASEFGIFRLIVPLVRPALAAVAVLTMIPVWNDLWWPLILAPAPEVRTMTLGAQQFLGQYANDYNALLAALTISMGPVLLMYALFSRQLIRGLTSGAVK